MMAPNHEQFRAVARYELLAPARLKPHGETCERSFEAGAVVSVDGYPTAAMRPINDEALYAKACAIRRALRTPSDIEDLAMLARSTDAPADCCGNGAAALLWLQGWLPQAAAKLKPTHPSTRISP
jgi:hypothetical protein